ncbi:MAG TPA: hypothetical protein VIG25_12585 [Pyrinomonadaceae bacterium]
MKSIKEVLTSPQFMREISFLLFIFAAFSGIIGVLTITQSSQPDVLAIGIGSLLAAVINGVLAFFIRRGYVIALWTAAVLFVLDTMFQLLQPTGALLARVLLIAILIRYIKRARANA